MEYEPKQDIDYHLCFLSRIEKINHIFVTGRKAHSALHFD